MVCPGLGHWPCLVLSPMRPKTFLSFICLSALYTTFNGFVKIIEFTL